MSDCHRCAVYQAENARLRAEVSRLKRENAILKNLLRQARAVIKRQRQQLDQIRDWAFQVMNIAEKALRKGNLPRGTWSFHRGQYEVAQGTAQLAGQDFATGILVAIAAVIGG